MRMKSKWFITVAVLALAMVVAAGCGGSAATSGGASQPSSAGQGSQPQGTPAAGQRSNSNNVAAGRVKKVDGSTIQVSTATEVLTVKTSAQTRFVKLSQGSLSDIQAGERLTAQGTRGSDGTFTAQMIQIGDMGGSQGTPGAPQGAGTGGGTGNGAGNGTRPQGTPGANGARGSNANNFAAGQVKQVDGNTIQLTTATAELTVKTSDKTRIQKLDQASLSDIQPDVLISVQGTRGSDGTFTAQTIRIGGQQLGAGGNAPAGGNPPDSSNAPAGGNPPDPNNAPAGGNPPQPPDSTNSN